MKCSKMDCWKDLVDWVQKYQKQELGQKAHKFGKPECFDLENDWRPDSYFPCHNKPGIYAIYGEDKKLLYIGKASNKSTIGSRLSSYFKNDKNNNKHKVIQGGWEGTPRYILAIPVKDAFQAPSLEEYLISKLKPKANIIGN